MPDFRFIVVVVEVGVFEIWGGIGFRYGCWVVVEFMWIFWICGGFLVELIFSFCFLCFVWFFFCV